MIDLDPLEQAINKRDIFIKSKYDRIELIKKQLEKDFQAGNNELIYRDQLSLFGEYQSFDYDTAYIYLDQARLRAVLLNDPLKLSAVKIKECFVLMSSGLFKEAIDLLEDIDPLTLPAPYKFDYYVVKARTFFDLAAYTSDDRFSQDYVIKGNAYLDMALVFVEPDSNEYWNTKSLSLLKKGDWQGAQDAFIYWMEHYDLPARYKAIATSSLAHVYAEQGQNDKNVEFLAKAAIADIESATRETVAIRNLASELFELGDLKKANRYISIAMEDATAYNARHRKTEISAILPIIEKAQIQKTEAQKSTLKWIVVLLSFLGVLVVIFLLIIFKQLKARNASRLILAESNFKLQKLNNNLKEVDSIKQEYITYFLRVTSGFLHKIDQLQKGTLHKIMAKRPDEVVQILKKTALKGKEPTSFNSLTRFSSSFSLRL